ncbi:MAG: DUF1592 domain-containing protein, partial [Planctomycetota bacterium]
LVFYGRLPVTTAPEDGWYRMKLKVKCLKPQINGTVWCTIRSGECYSMAPLMFWVDSFEATKTFKEVTVEAWLPKGHMFEVRPGDARIKKGQTRGGQVGSGEVGPQNVPGIAMESMTLERFHKGMTNKELRQRLFGDLDIKLSVNPTRSIIRPENPVGAAANLIRSFAYRAFRRKVSNESLKHYFEIVNESIKNGDKFQDSIKAGYRAILCSPRFMYFTEQPGELDDFAIASRLSYMLWNRMPDLELFKSAMSGDLKDPVKLEEQVERMLNHEYGQSFVKDFAQEWLDLRLIDFTEPDRKLYPGFDLIVQNSMVEETEQFLQYLVDRNSRIDYVVDSKHTFLDNRLASYYGIEGVRGDKMKRVKLPADSNRGGILTQGSVLKVTANGTTTSPVLRGVWVSERILGEHIPPPPENVPAIEPDIRGAKTIRDQLEKHKDDPNCSSCHQKMDPPGFALENFDPSGRWRDNYVKMKGRKKEKGLPVDSSDELGDEVFKNLDQFKALLKQRPRKLAKNFAEKLVTYGTGGSPTFADRPEIQKILDNAAKDDYGVRSLVKAVVVSPIFRQK